MVLRWDVNEWGSPLEGQTVLCHAVADRYGLRWLS